MKTKRILITVSVLVALLLAAGRAAGQSGGPEDLQALTGTAFTYQGELRDARGPVTGTCDLRFMLWNAASGGSQVGSTITLEGVEIEDGLFTARLDFGSVHDGSARWLEVAVRCPAGSGGYVTLSPRQELTGAPAALSLALPFHAEANVGGPLAWFENDGAGEAAGFSSAGGTALWVDSAGADGLHVGSVGQNGLAVFTAGTNGVHVNAAGANGLHVSTAGANGVLVSAASGRGLAVDAAGADGVYVGQAGNPSAVTPSEYSNGVEVAGAEGYGLYVGRADYGGVHVVLAGGDGVAADSAGGDGYYVAQANARGLGVGITGGDGAYVHQAGTPSSHTSSPQTNGFEVAGAQGYGLYVGRADLDGVYVNSTAWHGVNVNGSGVNGVYVTNAGNYGVAVASAGAGGVYGHSANGPGLRGESDQNYGVLAITTSSDPNEAALLAHNQGAGPAVEARGDLVVTGAYRGNIGPNGGAPFPRPAYDSGWFVLERGTITVLTHNLGGSVDNYVVDLSARWFADWYTYWGEGLSNLGIGGDNSDYGVTGHYWGGLNNQSIYVSRGMDDGAPATKEYRVRIWVYR